MSLAELKNILPELPLLQATSYLLLPYSIRRCKVEESINGIKRTNEVKRLIRLYVQREGSFQQITDLCHLSSLKGKHSPYQQCPCHRYLKNRGEPFISPSGSVTVTLLVAINSVGHCHTISIQPIV